ncbi:uncharacterized protein EI90DRAFT_2329636 [Cantharellus anzutake]|uniref:uncharacterized protein n=1 Tax=Cantharellus anzutake TaxID=1750568 RepID=UPI0019062702|nr:uncharacterized protein EI90DRAFT_2329636 [Cantharellus anzutake]KAF8324602.1 hypothetical protein EI90DRAFT_2329636 [Cantharellus anzutake]
MLSIVLRVILCVGLARATTNGLCDELGCQPDIQVVIGTTRFVDLVSTGPPFPDPTGVAGASVVGVHQNSHGIATVTYQVAGQTTLVVPRPTPAAPVRAETSYYIATSTVTRDGIVRHI